ncbi:WS/DGAT domain-containing protein [Rhodococcus sp. CC-R104]|uniref:WS/DGAT domain-containing protein n=1 Tax=Rhodococcus chondri TaxID=3065941 RepID=A0ABU7JXY2_9NOCA|nr:WS/DGAT domain-containing protein [Rhodococcus sp. CC-R104]
MGELRCRIRDVPGNLDYPYWEPRDFSDDLVVDHRPTYSSWSGLQSALGSLVSTSIDPRVSPWQLHVFRGVRGAPRCDRDALVVVLQVSHAFADGRRASALARALFGLGDPPFTNAPEPPPRPPAMLARALLGLPVRIVRLIAQGRRAAAANRALEQATTAGQVPAPAAGRPLVGLNVDPGAERVVRMVVCPAEEFRAGDHTVTVVALTAVSVALSRLLAVRGENVPDALGAEVTVAGDASGTARNNYRNAGVELFVTEPDLRVRAERIAGELARRRARLSSPLLAQRDSANDFVPAPLLRFGVDRYSLDAIPETVTGNTVVSSVNRGPADLALAGGPVVFSAGFPGLSPVMSLTHGVYGLGDTVTIGVTASPRVIPNLDDYGQTLREAVAEVSATLGPRAGVQGDTGL